VNKHILLVMKWLNDKDSVSQEELEKSKGEAYAAFAAYAAYAAFAAYAAYAAAAADYDYDYVSQAVYWVNRYFEETGEDRNEYLKELNK